jgi:putative ABC transport system ATP-binding protein
VRVAQQLAGRVDRDRIAALLDAVRLTGRAHARPSQLSGGETARAGLAVALANNPAILLADEPTGELDSVNEGLVVDLLTDLVETGSAVVVVTHNDAVAARADRIVALEDGRLAA